jgi:cytidine deaminase
VSAHDTDLQDLIDTAIAAAQRAYAPYSNYLVGAALLATDGRVYTGCNVENASYPAGICGERAALVKAISEGSRTFDSIVVATKNAGSPCGICRQMMYEFAPTMRVVLVDFDGKIAWDGRLDELLPRGFRPEDL